MPAHSPASKYWYTFSLVDSTQSIGLNSILALVLAAKSYGLLSACTAD
jgi:hypothetical protein